MSNQLALSVGNAVGTPFQNFPTFSAWGTTETGILYSSQGVITDYKFGEKPLPFYGSSGKIALDNQGEWIFNTGLGYMGMYMLNFDPKDNYIGIAPPMAALKSDGSYAYVSVNTKSYTNKPMTSIGEEVTKQVYAGQMDTVFIGLKNSVMATPVYNFQINDGTKINEPKTNAQIPVGTLVTSVDVYEDIGRTGNYLYGYNGKFSANDGTSTNDNTGYVKLGTYTIGTGNEFSFIPTDNYFTQADKENAGLIQKDAPPVDVVIANYNTHVFMRDANGNPTDIIYYGTIKPAYEIGGHQYNDVHTTYTATVKKAQPIKIKDATNIGNFGQTGTVTVDYGQESSNIVDLTTVHFVKSATDLSSLGRSLTVPNEGTWTIDDRGAFIFTPDKLFIGNPSPVYYTALDTKGGIPNSNYNVGKITLTYNSPVTTPAGTIGLMDTTQKTTDNNDKYDSNMGIDDMFKGFPETWYGDFTYSLIDPNTGAFVGNTFTIAGEGTYTIIDDGGRKAIEFVPVSSFSGTSQVDVGIENLNSGDKTIKSTYKVTVSKYELNYESDYAKLANGNELDSPFGEQNQDGVITITRGSHDVLRIQANPAQPEALPTLIANIADDTKLTHISIFTDSKDGYQLPAGWRVYAIDQSGAEIIDPTADYYGVDIRVDVPPYANTGDIAAFAAEITYSDGTKDIQTFRYTVNPRPSYIEYSYKDIMRYAGDEYTVNPEVNPLTQVAGYVEPIKREFSDEAGNLLTAATITDSKGTEWTIGTDIIIDGETGVISGKVPDGALSGAVLEVNVRTTYDNQDAATQGTNPHVYDYKTLRITVITLVTQPDYALLYGKPGETKNADISILYGEEYKTVFAKFDRQANEAKGWTIVDQLVDKEGTNLDTPSADLSNYKRVATTVQRSDGRIYPVVEIFDQNDVSLGYLSQKATNADGWEYKLNPSTGYIMSTIPETAKVGENASIQIHIEYNNDPNRFTKILADTYAIEKDAEKYEPNYPALVVTRGATDATLSTPIDLTTQQAFDNKDVQNFTIDNTAVPGWEISIDNATGQVSVKVDQSIPVGTKLTKDVTITYNDGSKDIVPVTFVANEQILNPNYAPKDGAVGDEIISEIIAIEPNNPTKQDYPPQGTKFILVSDSENWGVTIDEATGKLTGTVPLDKKPGEKTDLIVRVDYPDGTSELVATSFTVKAFTSETIDISAVKNWVGGDTANRPDIQLQLFRQATDDQGTPIGNKEFVGEAKTLTNGNTTAEWTSLPKQNETKQNYLYTVEEVQGAEGYTTAVTGDQTSGFTVTNTFVPEETYEFYYEMKTTAPGSDVVSDLVGTYPDGTTFEIVNSDAKWNHSIDKNTGKITGKAPENGNPGDTSIVEVKVTLKDGTEKTIKAGFVIQGGNEQSIVIQSVNKDDPTNLVDGKTYALRTVGTEIVYPVTRQDAGLYSAQVPKGNYELVENINGEIKSVKEILVGEPKSIPMFVKTETAKGSKPVTPEKPSEPSVIEKVVEKVVYVPTGSVVKVPDVRYEYKEQDKDKNYDHHIQYVRGYTDKTLRPDRSISRGEVAAIFARLLYINLDNNAVYQSKFSDINQSQWYSNYVGFLENKDIISGYPDGTFRGDNPITRAEFTKIASKFSEKTGRTVNFTDFTKAHWAYESVERALTAGYVDGYPDGTFKPDKEITRAEAVKITNKIFNRVPDKNYIDSHALGKEYIDLTKAHWAYYELMEASYNHDFTPIQNVGESWVRILDKPRKLLHSFVNGSEALVKSSAFDSEDGKKD